MPGKSKFVCTAPAGDIAYQPNTLFEIDHPAFVGDGMLEALVSVVVPLKHVEFASHNPTVHIRRGQAIPGKGSFRISLIEAVHLQGIVRGGGAEPAPAISAVRESSRIAEQFAAAGTQVNTEGVSMTVAGGMGPLWAGVDDQLLAVGVRH